MLSRLSFVLALAFCNSFLFSQTYWLEPECAATSAAWQKVGDPLASAQSIMQGLPPTNLFNPVMDPSQWLRVALSVDAAGEYTLFGRTKVLDPATNSLWFRVNGGNWMEWEDMGIETVSPSMSPPPTDIPVIPGARGFGMNTPAGRRGTVYKVSNLNDKGTGSLRACAEASGPRVCVFEVSGFIDLESNISIEDPYLTIAGQTAPSPGIVLGKGYGFVVETQDVLIQHIAILPGDQTGMQFKNRDAMQLSSNNPANRVHNIVLDHVSMAWGMDENLDLWGYFGDVSILNCIIAQNLNQPYDPVATSSYGNLLGSYDQQNRVYISGTFYAGNRDRQPLSRVKNLVMTNNLMYDRVLRFVYLSNRLSSGSGGFPTRNTLVGNAFVEGPSMAYSLPHEKPINFDQTGQFSTSELYVADNWWSFANYPDAWNYVKGATNSIQVNQPPVPFPDMEYESDPQQVIANVLAQAGSHPADRNPVDQKLIEGFENGYPLVRECVSGCPSSTGGWPDIPFQFRPLILPNDPSGDIDADGYTNLEEWLHAFSRAVEQGETDYRWEQAPSPTNAGAPLVLSLDTGLTVLEFAVREPGINLDKLCLTRDNLIPTGLGETGIPCDSLPKVPAAASLPVKLMDFSAEADAENLLVQLSWTTSEETQNDHFTLEKSIDGWFFSPIADVPSQGNSNRLQSYQYDDMAPITGKSYYRLKQTDFDGNFQYFSPVRVNFSVGGQQLAVRVYPIPVTASRGETLQADVWSDGLSPLRFELFNALGQKCWEQETTPFSGWRHFEIETSALQAGFHTLLVRPVSPQTTPYFTKRLWVY